MPAERRRRILAALVGDGGTQVQSARLCEVSAEIIGMSGAGIMLMSDDAPRGSLCSSNPVSARLEQLQYELGEGPCVDAHIMDRPVMAPDLAGPEATPWIAFTEPAVAAGARAVFGFPLRVGAVRLGALNVYCDRPGPLTAEQHADALVMADVAAHAVLSQQTEAATGQLTAEFAEGADFHDVVHQASGMASVQLGISVGQALVRLRAHAFGNERTLDAVARDVVTRSLRFSPDDDARQRPPKADM